MVAVVLPHSIECIASMLAAVKLGAAFAPLNGTYPPDRLAYIFHDCQAKAVITPDFMKDVADYSPAAGNAPVTPEDAALLVYTSGSTGNPKGVLIDHCALIDSINRTLQFAEVTGQDVVGLGAPFGLFADIPDGSDLFPGQTLTLRRGDMLVQYTDGVTEAIHEDHRFEEAGLLSAVTRAPSAKPEQLLAYVRQQIDLFAGREPQYDDITMMGLMYNGPQDRTQDRS